MLALAAKQYRHCSHERQKGITPRRFPLKPLSLEEVCQVNLATFREGVNHCRWPREVIEKFLAVQA